MHRKQAEERSDDAVSSSTASFGHPATCSTSRHLRTNINVLHSRNEIARVLDLQGAQTNSRSSAGKLNKSGGQEVKDASGQAELGGRHESNMNGVIGFL